MKRNLTTKELNALKRKRKIHAKKLTENRHFLPRVEKPRKGKDRRIPAPQLRRMTTEELERLDDQGI